MGSASRAGILTVAVIAALLTTSCSRTVDCTDEAYDWIDDPDLAFVATVDHTTPSVADVTVLAVERGDPPTRLEIGYPDPGLLHSGDRYRIRASDLDSDGGFESIPFCGATRTVDGSPIDTSWTQTMRARLPSTPVTLAIVGALLLACAWGALVFTGRIDSRLRRRFVEVSEQWDEPPESSTEDRAEQGADKA